MTRLHKLSAAAMIGQIIPDEHIGRWPTLREAYLTVLGGVAACSPRAYECSLRAIARMTGRDCNAVFRAEFVVIAKSVPCLID